MSEKAIIVTTDKSTIKANDENTVVKEPDEVEIDRERNIKEIK